MTVLAVQPPGTGEPVLTEYKCHYRVEIAAGHEGCEHCGMGKYWTVVFDDENGEPTEIGTSWGDEELTGDICDLMNMAFEVGKEAPQADGEVKR
jgi:hypothetical protein